MYFGEHCYNIITKKTVLKMWLPKTKCFSLRCQRHSRVKNRTFNAKISAKLQPRKERKKIGGKKRDTVPLMVSFASKFCKSYGKIKEPNSSYTVVE